MTIYLDDSLMDKLDRVRKGKKRSRIVQLLLEKQLDAELGLSRSEKLKRRPKQDIEDDKSCDKTFEDDVSYIDWERPREELFWDRTTNIVGGKAIAIYSGGGYGIERIDKHHPHFHEAVRICNLKGNIFDLREAIGYYFHNDGIAYELIRSEFPFLTIDPYDKFARENGIDVRVNNGIWESQVAVLAPNDQGVNNGSPMLAPEKKKSTIES